MPRHKIRPSFHVGWNGMMASLYYVCEDPRCPGLPIHYRISTLDYPDMLSAAQYFCYNQDTLCTRVWWRLVRMRNAVARLFTKS